jgi:hypothetical protein
MMLVHCPSIADALEHFAEVLSMAEEWKRKADAGWTDSSGRVCPPGFYRELDRTIPILRDVEELRRRLKPYELPDGSVVFSPETITGTEDVAVN